MRKTSVSFITCLLLSAFALAQAGSTADSLRLIVNSASTDTARAQALIDIGLYFQETNRDSAVLYSNELMNLAEKMNNPLAKVTGIALKAYTFYHQGDLLDSYKLLNEGLEIVRDKEKNKVKWIPAFFGRRRSPEDFMVFCESTFIMYQAFIYEASGNVDKSIEYYKQSIAIAMPFNEKNALLGAYTNLGSTYIAEKKPDSALVYTTKALQYSKELGETFLAGAIHAEMADIYFLKAQPDSALHYNRNALALAKQAEFRLVEIQSMLRLSRCFEKKQQTDSMLFYARNAFMLSDEFRQLSTKGEAAELIAQALKMKEKMDSAYSYLSISKNIGDSLSKKRNKSQTGFQSFNFEEQLRLEKAAQENSAYRNRIRTIAMITGIGLASLLAWIFYRNNRRKQKDNKVLESALTDLKATQGQLIQAEKMASLGELTAGIAHEIQNPLNFVNNFSELNKELTDELGTELATGNLQSANEILADIRDNSEKINQHGKRADAIVKGMLQHSRSSSGQKELTDINALCDEYLRLSYHGLRARDKSFNAEIKTDFENTGTVSIVPQDIGRVLLNLFNNAFYAVNDRKKKEGDGYTPTVSVSTRKLNNSMAISIKDNGPGIPQKIVDKIFQPFFTTKPTGQGTGLGLSMSYDVIRAHGGELKVETQEGEGATFLILLPVNIH